VTTAAGAGSGAARGVTVQPAASTIQATVIKAATRVRCDPGALTCVSPRSFIRGSSCEIRGKIPEAACGILQATLREWLANRLAESRRIIAAYAPSLTSSIST
jgi:hypothetical protein